MQSAPKSEVLLPCNASGLDDITLLYVTSSAQSEGTYRCTLRYADEEEVTHIELKIIELKIPEDPMAGRLLMKIQTHTSV
jgi:hypothetical protein